MPGQLAVATQMARQPANVMRAPLIVLSRWAETRNVAVAAKEARDQA